MMFNRKSCSYLTPTLALCLFGSAALTTSAKIAMAQTAPSNQPEAERLLNLCREHLNTQQFPAALRSCQQAATAAQTAGDRATQARALNNVGQAYLNLDRAAQASEYYQQSLNLARRIPDRRIEILALRNLVLVYIQLDEYAKAMELAQQGLPIAQELKDTQTQAILLARIGVVYRTLKNYPKSELYLQQSLKIATENGDRPNQYYAWSNLGTTYRRLNNYSQSIASLQQSLTLARELKDRSSEMVALDNLAATYIRMADYPKALEAQSQALAIARSLKNQAKEYNYLGHIGLIHKLNQNPAQALQFYQQQITLAQQLQNPQLQAEPLKSLGKVYLDIGEYAKATDALEQAIKMAQSDGNHELELEALGILGDVYVALADNSRLVETFQQQLTLARKVGDRVMEMNALAKLGTHYHSIDTDKALNLFQQQLTIAQQVADQKQQTSALESLSDTYFQARNLTQALAYNQQSLVLAKKLGDRWEELKALISLGNIYMMQDNPQAIDTFKQAVSIGRNYPLIRGGATILTLRALGNAYNRFKKFPEAAATFQESLAIAQKLQDPESAGRSLEGLGEALARSGKLPEAERTLRQAMELWESIRQDKLGNRDDFKISIFEEQGKAYQLLQAVLVEQNRPNEALEIAERGRARAFVDLLTQRLSSNPALNAISKPPTLADMQQIAKQQDATLVQYSILREDADFLLTWVIRPSGEVTFHAENLRSLDKSLADLVIDTRESLGISRATLVAKIPDAIRRQTAEQQTEQQKTRLRKLHQLLIAPIARQLPTDANQRVIFIPQGALFLVPFPALLDANNQPLIARHTILTAPSIQVLALTRQQRQRQPHPSGTALVLGNPVMPPGLIPLPGAEREARAIAPLLNTTAITGKQGTKLAIQQQMSQARIIHLATHGWLDDQRGLGSAIALAPAGQDNGWLTATEILNMKLNADLVTLSACDTGRGRITGDGVIGLSRSFISAGVPSIIVSLWAVPDAPTAELMTEFYTNWQVKKLDKAQALRQAMLTTLKTHPNPRDWAAFTLIGEAE
jgi:CHAT domain-containing protein/Tfp pilus assembly protein PilF